jgi:hypothetical protein
MEINLQALAGGMYNRSDWRLSTGVANGHTTASNAVMEGL